MPKLVLEVRTLCPGNTNSQVMVEVDSFGCCLFEVPQPTLFQTILSAFWNIFCFIAC